MISINHSNLRHFEDTVLTEVLTNICEVGVEAGKLHLHVDTGRLRESFRASEPERNGDEIEVKLIAGGLEVAGIVREQGIVKPVDYAGEEEIRHPQIRTYVIPALMGAIQDA